MSISAYATDLLHNPSVGLCVGGDGCVGVCLSVGRGPVVRKVYCGKTAEWIWMPFGTVSGPLEGWVY